jgi:transcriptional regulator with XRE-family HTH domain
MSFSDQIRTAIKSSGKSIYRIALETKMEEKRLSRFVNGRGGLNLGTLDRVAAYLGIKANRTDTLQQPHD